MTTRLFSLLTLAVLLTTANAAVTKKLITSSDAGPNLLREDRWHKYETGFTRVGETLVCENAETSDRRGASQSVTLNQERPVPIVAEAWSKAESVTGSRDNNYSLYLDLTYTDGTPLWGQVANFTIGTHDWEHRKVVIMPSKPVKHLSFHLLLRGHRGKALFRGATLRQIHTAAGSAVFDGLPTTSAAVSFEGFQVRDVAAESDFHSFEGGRALGLHLEEKREQRGKASIIEAAVSGTTGSDRAVTLVYTLPVSGTNWQWLANPRTQTNAVAPAEYSNVTRFHAGSNGSLSKYPFAAIARGNEGVLLGIDPKCPAFFRCAFNASTGELFLAFDLGLATEKPIATLRLVKSRFRGADGFRGALQRYYELFPDSFQCRTPNQGIWMPFDRISKVEGWQDFGFKFKEGDNETAWDDAHDIITFRYTEPMTWWMAMRTNMPRTLDAALAEARRLADTGKSPHAQALFTSGYRDEQGNFVAKLLDTPWCNGAVWSINSMPAIAGEVSDFSTKWNPQLRDRLYGPQRKADLDGEYIDSSEGYVTDELDFCREHFTAAQFPLTFSPESRRPAIFRGLIAAEYTKKLSEDVHAMGKLMMANSTPSSLCWLAPWLDVMGTETDWNRPARHEKKTEATQFLWKPMSDEELLYRRAMCGPKPYCFLMNTHFPVWTFEMTEKFMKRCLAYGVFPGFFSANASSSTYFSQPALYNRDRTLFKKYLPLCKRVAESGWKPIAHARVNHPRVYAESFGDRFVTIFNDTSEKQTVTVSLDDRHLSSVQELISDQQLKVERGSLCLQLGAEDVAVLEIK